MIKSKYDYTYVFDVIQSSNYTVFTEQDSFDVAMDVAVDTAVHMGNPTICVYVKGVNAVQAKAHILCSQYSNSFICISDGVPTNAKIIVVGIKDCSVFKDLCKDGNVAHILDALSANIGVIGMTAERESFTNFYSALICGLHKNMRNSNLAQLLLRDLSTCNFTYTYNDASRIHSMSEKVVVLADQSCLDVTIRYNGYDGSINMLISDIPDWWCSTFVFAFDDDIIELFEKHNVDVRGERNQLA